MISVEFETPDRIPAGGELRGFVAWQPEPNARARSMRIAMRWFTRGRGDRDQRDVAVIEIPFTAGVPTEPTRFPFAFTVPPDGPVTYFGNLLTIEWEIQARLDVSWAVDPSVARLFAVVPRLR